MKNSFDYSLFVCLAKGEDDKTHDYDRGAIVDAARAFARSSHKCVYVVDFYEWSVLFASNNFVRLLGRPAEALAGRGCGILLDHILEKERATVIDQHRLAMEFLDSVPIEERSGYVFHCDFHVVKDGRRYLVHHTATPFHSSVGGHVEAALCTVAPSSESEAGSFYIMEEGGEWSYEYSCRRHSWERKKVAPLSDMEREVLWLSLQGHAMAEIALRIFRSLDSVKMYKRILFGRLKVKSVVQAVAHAFNSRLF